MEIIYAPSGIISVLRPGQGILDVSNAGFENILLDFSRFCSPGELEALGQTSQNRAGIQQPKSPQISKHPPELCHVAGPLSLQLQKEGISTPMARAPYLLTATKRQDLNELLLLLARESIRVCKEAGCESILIEPLFSGVPLPCPPCPGTGGKNPPEKSMP